MAEELAGSIFYEVAALLVLASAVGLAGVLLRQPLIVGFILVGILAGPAGIGIVRSDEHILLLSELGVSLLLFLVGLKLDLHLIRTLGAVALSTGLGQVAFTAGLGFFICLALGIEILPSLYIAVALTFSSTIIIVKLLSDKGEIDSLHGRIALGFLIVQDLVVVIAMVALSAFGIGAGERAVPGGVLGVLASGVGLVAAVGLFIRYAADRLLALLARTPELLVVFAIGWAALLASVGDVLGFGKELGGLLAGVSLASTPYREAVAARLSSLRDFLLLFFFVGLGSRLHFGDLGEQAGPALALSLFVLIGNPFIVLLIMGAMGYRRRTGFLAGLTVAQISEFSLIFMAMGLSLGHVGDGDVALVTLVGLVTIAVSTYMIVYSWPLFALMEPLLRPFERRVPHREDAVDNAPSAAPDVVIFGLGRYGSALHGLLSERGLRVLGVDFNPAVVAESAGADRAVLYGDAADPDFIRSLPLQEARLVVCATPTHIGSLAHAEVRGALLHALRAAGYGGRMAVRAEGRRDVERMQALGVDIVLQPFVDASEHAVARLLDDAGLRSGGPGEGSA